MNIDFEELAIKFNKYLISLLLPDPSHATKFLEGPDDLFLMIAIWSQLVEFHHHVFRVYTFEIMHKHPIDPLDSTDKSHENISIRCCSRHNLINGACEPKRFAINTYNLLLDSRTSPPIDSCQQFMTYSGRSNLEEISRRYFIADLRKSNIIPSSSPIEPCAGQSRRKLFNWDQHATNRRINMKLKLTTSQHIYIFTYKHLCIKINIEMFGAGAESGWRKSFFLFVILIGADNNNDKWLCSNSLH